MDYTIGDAIRKKIEEKGMTFVSFADKFGITDRNLQYLFKKSDLSMHQIVRASEILQYDFVLEYLTHRKSKFSFKNINEKLKPESKESNIQKVTMTISIAGAIDSYTKNFPDFLKGLSTEALKYGFDIV